MTSAFVLDNETILCRHTVAGWWPLQVALPNTEDLALQNDAVVSDATDADAYQVGRVELIESLAPSHWEEALKHTETKDFRATSAITSHYAEVHGIAIPDLSTASDTLLFTPETEGAVDNSQPSDTVDFISYRQLITQLPAALAAQLSQAIQLLRWQADTQFCSRCSAPVHADKSGERAMVCQVCRLRQYPRVQPCIITAITRPNPKTGEMQILLAHHHRYGKPSSQLQYGLIAGFVEVGESLEHAVVREVAEEVAISLTDIRYVSSQPWPFPSNLMLGFRASYASGEIAIQQKELSHANFFDLSNLPKIPFKGSIAYELIAQIMHEQGMSL